MFIHIIHSNKVTAALMRQVKWGRNQEKQSHFLCILQNRFNHTDFRFYGWTGWFFYYFRFLDDFRFLAIIEPDCRLVPSWTGRSGPIFKTMIVTILELLKWSIFGCSSLTVTLLTTNTQNLKLVFRL